LHPLLRDSSASRKTPTDQILVIPYKINQLAYKVSRKKAEQMVARGQATWPNPDLRRIKETGAGARGQMREWKKTPCEIAPGVFIPTMQLVEPEDRRNFGRTPTKRNHASNRKRQRMSPQDHPKP